MRGLILGKTYILAKEKLSEIIHGYEEMKIDPIYCNVTDFKTEIEYSNGDYWEAIRFSDNARGKRVNVIYVDKNIINETMSIVSSAATASPYNAIRIF